MARTFTVGTDPRRVTFDRTADPRRDDLRVSSHTIARVCGTILSEHGGLVEIGPTPDGRRFLAEWIGPSGLRITRESSSAAGAVEALRLALAPGGAPA